LGTIFDGENGLLGTIFDGENGLLATIFDGENGLSGTIFSSSKVFRPLALFNPNLISIVMRM
jgi:hypothetical protein